MGYAIYDLRAGTAHAHPPSLWHDISNHSLENARYKVTLNAAGDIASVFDKSLKRETSLRTGAPCHPHGKSCPAIQPGTWIGKTARNRLVITWTGRLRFRLSKRGRPGWRWRWSGQQRTQHLSSRSVWPRAARANGWNSYRIDWRAAEASLRAHFPFAATNPDATFDDKVGVVSRGNDNPNRFEMAQQQWMDLTNTDGTYGVSVLNDSKYGSDKPDDHTLRSTLIYTPGTRGGTPDQGTQDQGRHEILLGLAGHRGDWVEGRVPWQAARLNQPLRAFLPKGASRSAWPYFFPGFAEQRSGAAYSRKKSRRLG